VHMNDNSSVEEHDHYSWTIKVADDGFISGNRHL
jgi:hypothetical protein